MKMKTPLIIIANTNRNELETLAQELQQEGYETLGAVNADELHKALHRKKKAALVVLDMSGFDESVWERCSYMHEAKIPFIVIEPQRSPVIQRNSMKHGASGLLVKPLSNKELIEHIHTVLGD
jgi:DNA-binding NtrC family response regulator